MEEYKEIDLEKTFSFHGIDEHIIHNKNFIPRKHQIMPKYYLASNQTNSLILHYSLGSGKTCSAAFSVLSRIQDNQNINFIGKFMQHDYKSVPIAVVGSWQTQAQFEMELMRPEFKIIPKSVINEINNMLNSDDAHIRALGARKLEYTKRSLRKFVRYYGYQKFFTEAMDFDNKKQTQNIKQLMDDFKHNRLSISKKFLKEYYNSYIIIDEMQKLYSTNGLNTYGLVISMLLNVAQLYNIKVIFLTGTIFNNSITELEFVKNFFSPSISLLPRTDNIVKKRFNEEIQFDTLTEDSKEEYRLLLKDHIMYYEQNNWTNTGLEYSTLIVTDEQPPRNESLRPVNTQNRKYLESNVYVPQLLKDEAKKSNVELKAIVLPYTKRLPDVVFIGTTPILSDGKHQPLITFTLTLEGAQNEMYKKLAKDFTDLNSLDQDQGQNDYDFLVDADKSIEDDDEDDEAIVKQNINRFKKIQQANLEEDQHSILGVSQYYIPKGRNSNIFITDTNGIYRSSYIGSPKLAEYSKTAYVVIKAAIDLACHEEKTIIHTTKISNFGIEQYIYMLCENGCVHYGDDVKSNSICKQCGLTFDQHEEADHKFRPIFVHKLTGLQSTKERSHITNNLFNIERNLHGDVISILVISDVAYFGVSFYNTQNIMLISNHSNISKWRQTYSRIIRTNSHDMLPWSKQYAKVYTFNVKSDVEECETAIFNNYYKLKMAQNLEIEDFMVSISKDCVNNIIEKSNFLDKVSEESKNNIKFLLMNDIQDELNLIAERIFNDSHAIIWSKDKLLSKIKDISRNFSFINFQIITDEYILTNLLINNIFYNDNQGNFILTPFQQHLLNLDDCMLNTRHKDVKYNIELTEDDIKKYSVKDEGFELEYIKSFNNIKQNRIKYMKMYELITNVFKDKWLLMNNYPELSEYLYEIYDEYYEDDPINFIHNHSSKGRSYSKMVGFYNCGQIVTFDGEMKPILQKINNEDVRPFGELVFKIMCQKSATNNRFSLYIIISDISRLKSSAESGDRRYTSSGINCESFDVERLKKMIPEIDTTMSKTKLCTCLLQYICDYQIAHPKKRYVITPYETMYV